jgi:hypothetical protein
MDSNLFNFDFVKAKTGKVLSKTEKNIQYIFNLVISRTVQFFVIGIIAMVVISIVKMLWHFLIS